jgi:hypothetical protein
MLHRHEAIAHDRAISRCSPTVAAIAAITTVTVTAAIAAASTAASTTATAAATTAAPAAAATTTAAATEAATAAAATTTAAAAAARLTLFGLVHANRAALNQGPVQLSDSVLSFLSSAHGHEAEASRLATLSVGDDMNVNDVADRSKGGAQRLRRRLERQVAYIQTITHDFSIRSRGPSFSEVLPSDEPPGSAPGLLQLCVPTVASLCRSDRRDPEIEKSSSPVPGNVS